MTSRLEQVIERQRREISRREAPVYRTLQRAYSQTVASLTSNLTAITERIASAIEAGEPVSRAWLLREHRYRSLLTQAEAQFARFGGEATNTLLAATTEASVAGAADATALLRMAGVDVQLGNRLSTAATERLAASLQPGSPVARVVSSYGTAAREVIERRLLEAVTQGLNPRDVTRRIVRDLDNPLQRARLLSLVRTETMRSHRSASLEKYAEHADLIRAIRWKASLSTRSCLACLSRDGTEWAPEDYPNDHHVNCRCVPVPVVHGNRVAFPQTGEQWFRDQPADVQRAMLGRAYPGFASGDISLRDFERVSTDSRWGPSVTQRSTRDVLRRTTAASAA